MGEEALGVSLCDAVAVIKHEFQPAALHPSPMVPVAGIGGVSSKLVARIALIAVLLLGGAIWLAWPEGFAVQQNDDQTDIPYRYSMNFDPSS
jgi:hypothetical protein